ncbi:tumor necrosis factor receptor superfamily member 11B-like [Trichomycterus rosablanca]|uniref:tumor necrosis factor receptor superfamily member 11B-like n=1 Tax=Trichomycterus rosablanca TaxID=2290929 RepID=UPI002F34F350
MANIIIMAVLALVSSVGSLASFPNETTYERTLSSGQKVVCDRCAPGFHLHTHCTKTRKTVCHPCDEGFYTEYWNYILECLPCNFCSSEQVLKRQCSSSQNSVCECKEGYYWHKYYCKRHTQCPSGYGIKKKGTPYKDTLCEPCLHGYFAPKDKKFPCLPHTPCKTEEKLLLHGTDTFDNVCATCNDITGEGKDELIRSVLQKTSSHHKSRWLQRWLNNTTAERVKELPAKLREHNKRHLADKVDQKIYRIVNLCSNGIMD